MGQPQGLQALDADERSPFPLVTPVIRGPGMEPQQPRLPRWRQSTSQSTIEAGPVQLIPSNQPQRPLIMRRAGDSLPVNSIHPAIPIQLTGIEPSSANDIVRALEHAGFTNTVMLPTTHNFDLAEEVVPGIVMAGVGPGAEVRIDAVRALFEARASAVRIIAVVATRSLELRELTLAAGASAVITLPTDRSGLLATVGAVAEIHLAHAELQRLGTFDPQAGNSGETSWAAHAEITMLSRVVRVTERLDPEVGRHSRRVADLAARTAIAMGFTNALSTALRRAARVHDVGKLVIPRAVLDAKDKLGKVELAVMRSHAALGANMLAGGDGALLKLAGDVAYTHHEWWDGRGYPRGLEGEAIPTPARIVSVVDAYDAMTSNRCYRRALTPAKAVQELKTWSGSQFDPEVVSAFLGVLEAEAVTKGCSDRSTQRP